MIIECLLAAAALALLALFLLLPEHAPFAKKAPFSGWCYAHRGLHSPDKSVPENSLAAFAAAADAGYGMELDVQLSKDGEVVVFHDDTLDRVTGVAGRVDAFDWAELKEMPLCGTGHHMPLFTEVLATVAGRTPLIVELKSGPRNKELCRKTLALLRSYEGAFCVESFDPTIVAWFRRNAPDILRGQLSDSCASFRKDGSSLIGSFVLSRCMGNFLARPQFIAWGPNPKNAAVRLTEAFGPMKVFWTARPGMDHAALTGEYDGVIFEHYAPPARY